MTDTITALVQRNQGKTLSKEQIPTPKPGPNEILVKISHAAQNPTDIQTFDANALGDGAVLGCDFVGEVTQLGSDVTRKSKGDVIAGLIWGGEIHGLGAYSTYTLADERISFKLPNGTSREEAATIPLAAGTAQLALFSEDCLNIPRHQSQFTSTTPATTTSVLIWGGSSSVGHYAIQLAKLHHHIRVITTCSPKNFQHVRTSGADHVFDYKDDDVVEKIKNAAGPEGLKYVFDTIGAGESSTLSSQAIHEEGGVLVTVRPGKVNTENVSKQTTVRDVLVWTAFLKEHRYKEFYWPPHKKDHELVAELFEKLPQYLEEGSIKPNKASVKKGLGAVEEGFQEYRDGKISGYKIVYSI